MKVFFDFEFTGLTQKTTPISLGLVSEKGRTFYAEFNDFDPNQITEWVTDNVLPNLRFKLDFSSTPELDYEHHAMKSGRSSVAACLSNWLAQFKTVEMWGDVLAYDWVLFCQLFGGALSLPGNVQYIPMDLATYLALNGYDPDIDRAMFAESNEGAAHNALVDARLIKACYEKLTRIIEEGKGIGL